MFRSLLRGVAALLVCLCASTGCVTAQPLPTLDSARLLSDMGGLAHDSMEGRAPGTPGSRRAQAFLENALGETGARPLEGRFASEFSWTRGSGVNFVGVVPGRGGRPEVIVLTA